ncbi:winged helix-turn-helix transcriptional regulator [Candidatus Woesearchaeota archaeon]|nr:winged helix-turn-helix transcriptional regulator [Candidatus Woesearchaeota archaeon]
MLYTYTRVCRQRKPAPFTIGGTMRGIDHQENLILRELIKNPRISDNQIGKNTRVPIRTVNRKRKKMEEEGIIQYLAKVNYGESGIGTYGAQISYILKFKIGIQLNTVIEEIRTEPKVKSVFTKYILDSFLIEYSGHIGLFIIIEGKNHKEITELFNSVLLPSLERNHGKGCVVGIEAIPIIQELRYFHNYLPFLNMAGGIIKKDWPNENIFVS